MVGSVCHSCPFPAFRFLAANLAQEAFGRDDNALTLFHDKGETELPRAPKITLARQLIAHIAGMLPKLR